MDCEEIKPENERIKKTVKEFGTKGAHTTLPYNWIGEKVLIVRLGGEKNMKSIKVNPGMKRTDEIKNLEEEAEHIHVVNKVGKTYEVVFVKEDEFEGLECERCGADICEYEDLLDGEYYGAKKFKSP